MCELGDTRLKLQSALCLVQQSCKTNSMLNEDKQSLEKILDDNAAKLTRLREERDEAHDKMIAAHADLAEMRLAKEASVKQANETRASLERAASEREEASGSLERTRAELATAQASVKSTTKRLALVAADKDKLQQTLALYEKEIQLLKQADALQKSQDESKLAELAASVQQKLAQKRARIDELRAKLSGAESTLNAWRKERERRDDERRQLDAEVRDLRDKLEQAGRDKSAGESELDEWRQRALQCDKLLENANGRCAELEKRNEALHADLGKFKKLFGKLRATNINQPQPKAPQQQQQQQTTCGSDLALKNHLNQYLNEAFRLFAKCEGEAKSSDEAQRERDACNLMRMLLETTTTSANTDLDSPSRNTCVLTTRVIFAFCVYMSFILLFVYLESGSCPVLDNMESKLEMLSEIGLGLKRENRGKTPKQRPYLYYYIVICLLIIYNDNLYVFMKK